MLLKKRWHGKFLNNIAGWPYILKITIGVAIGAYLTSMLLTKRIEKSIKRLVNEYELDKIITAIKTITRKFMEIKNE